MAPASALLCLKTPFYSSALLCLKTPFYCSFSHSAQRLPVGIRPLCSAPMAAVDGVVPPARSRLAVAAAHAVVYLLLASAWVSIAGVGALFIEFLACGVKCPAVIHAASTVMLVGGLSFLILGCAAALLFSKFVQPASYTSESEKRAATQGTIDSTVMAVHIISSAAFTILEVVGFLLKCVAVRGSRLDRVASVIFCAPLLGMIAMNCFVVLPCLAVKMWTMRPFDSASRSAIFSYDMEQQVVAK